MKDMELFIIELLHSDVIGAQRKPETEPHKTSIHTYLGDLGSV